jgi:hypothetical protein
LDAFDLDLALLRLQRRGKLAQPGIELRVRPLPLPLAHEDDVRIDSVEVSNALIGALNFSYDRD